VLLDPRLVVTGWVNRTTMGCPTPIPLWAGAAGAGARFAAACAVGVIVVITPVVVPVLPAGFWVTAVTASCAP